MVQAAKASDGMGVLLPGGLAFQFGRQGFENRLVGGIEGVFEALPGRAVAGLDELHHRDGGDGRGGRRSCSSSADRRSQA